MFSEINRDVRTFSLLENCIFLGLILFNCNDDPKPE